MLATLLMTWLTFMHFNMIINSKIYNLKYVI